MDNILQRMLTVDREAEAGIQAATAEAERLLAAGRRAAAELERDLRAEITAEAEALIGSAVTAAEERRRAALTAADSRIAEHRKAFTRQLLTLVDDVVAEIAYPFSAARHRNPPP